VLHPRRVPRLQRGRDVLPQDARGPAEDLADSSASLARVYGASRLMLGGNGTEGGFRSEPSSEILSGCILHGPIPPPYPLPAMTHLPPPDRIARDLRWLKAYAVLSSLALVVLLFGGFSPSRRRFEVIDVERLNVVNVDGKPALVLAGRGRLPGPMFEGREYPQELSGGRVEGSGMLFFNERGDEVGGLTYRGQLGDAGYVASAGLAFDQFRQDQAIAISYDDVNGERLAAIRVWDRPEAPIAPVVDRLWEVRQMPTGPERDRAMAEARSRVGGVTRMVVGKTRDHVVGVSLADPQGKTRVRLQVDEQGTPSLEFLSETGEVLMRLPEARPGR